MSYDRPEVRITRAAHNALQVSSLIHGGRFDASMARDLPGGYVGIRLSRETIQTLDDLGVDAYDPEALSAWIEEQA